MVFSGRGYTIHDFGRKSLIVVAYEKDKPRLFKALGTKNIAQAKAEAKKAYNDYIKEKIADARPNNLLSDHWDNLKKRREIRKNNKDLGENTFIRGNNAWKRLEWFWGDRLPSEITQENFDLFKAEMEIKYPKCSLKNEHKYLNVLAKDLFHRGVLRSFPKIHIGKSKKGNVKDKRLIPDEHMVLIREAAAKVQDPLFKLFMYMTMHGLRIEEVCHLEWGNLEKIDGKYFWQIVKGKTGPRKIRLATFINDLLDSIDKPSRFVFRLIREDRAVKTQVYDRRFREFMATLGSYQHHEFRHYAISKAIIESQKPIKVSRYFGVSLKEIDETYAKLLSTDSEECADALEF